MSAAIPTFPASRAGRDRFVIARRPPRNPIDPLRPYAFFVEDEPREPGTPVDAATILLSNRECPWRCTMCDLWKNTLEGPTPKGAIPAQVRFALERLRPARVLKLYNAGSFFDTRAIPVEDHAGIAALVRGFDRVVVECHPALVGDAVPRFRDLLGGPELEVAMGLETAHEGALEKLNKGMKVSDFERAAAFLCAHGIRLRSFLLVGIPFLEREEWPAATRAGIDVSFRAGADLVSLIPTRGGNGTLEELQRQALFTPPTLSDLERAIGDFFEDEGRGHRSSIGSASPLLLVDLWDVDALGAPPCCAAARVNRLREMNLIQRNLPLPPCSPCSRPSSTLARRA